MVKRMMLKELAMELLRCPYLEGIVELTDERRQHMLLTHPDFLPEHVVHQVVETLTDPDEIRRDTRFPATRLFFRWFTKIKHGKFVVVAVVSDPPPPERHWVVIAYITRKLTQGVIEWKRS